MKRSSRDSAKKGREASPPSLKHAAHLRRAICIHGKGETTFTAPKVQKAAAATKLPQPFFCAKSSQRPVLAGTDTQTVLAGILTHASQVTRSVFSEQSNDRLSPPAGTSTLTVAVPLGTFTRFPILSQDPSGPGSTKTVIYFRES